MKKKERLLCINLSNAQKQQLKDEIKAFYIDEPRLWDLTPCFFENLI